MVNFDGGQRVTSSAQACRAAQCRPGPPGLGMGSAPSLFGYEDMNTLSSRASDLTKSWEDAVDSYNYSGCSLSCGWCHPCVLRASCAHLPVFSGRHVTAHPQSSGTLMKTDGENQFRIKLSRSPKLENILGAHTLTGCNAGAVVDEERGKNRSKHLEPLLCLVSAA